MMISNCGRMFGLMLPGRRQKSLINNLLSLFGRRQEIHQSKPNQVSFLVDPVDEAAIRNLKSYKEKNFVDISKENLDLDEEKEKEVKQEVGPTCDWIKKRLDDKVTSVQTSNRLSTSPYALVSAKFGWSANMERLMKAQTLGGSSGLGFMRGRRVFENNSEHKIIKGLNVYALSNQSFFIGHRRLLSSTRLFDISSRGGGRHSGSGCSVGGRGLCFLVKTSPASIDRKPTSADDNDHDTLRLSDQHSQIRSTSSLGMMCVYRTKSGFWKFANSGSTSRTICDILKRRITSFWPSFNKVPSPVKDQWFEEFKALYAWDPTTSFVDVRRLWENKCSLNYRQIVSDMKISNMRYACISDEVWHQFVEYWDRKEVKELAKKIFTVHNKNPKQYKYGYKLMTKLANDMKKKLGRTPTFMEVYIRTHYVENSDISVDNEWINEYLEAFYMHYKIRVIQMTELKGRELSHDELDLLFIYFTQVREIWASSRSIDTGNTPEIYKDNTYSGRSVVLNDTKRLMEEMQELKSNNQELRDKVDMLEKEMSLLSDFMREMRQEWGQGSGFT